MLAAGAAELLRDAEGLAATPASLRPTATTRLGGRPRVTVYLVGAGPGDPGLLTVRAVELIGRADAILYDRLIPPRARRRPPGRRADLRRQGGGGPQVPQEETERAAGGARRAGPNVVRLKGGDPFVFGRGGEEALALREAGIPFEVVPGVTAGVAAPAYAGIPVTQRERRQRGRVRHRPRGPGQARDRDRLAGAGRVPRHARLLHGRRALPRIAERLVAGGRDAGEPVAVVQRGTLPGQRTVLGTLATSPSRPRRARAPAITLVGPVAACASGSPGSRRGRCPGAGSRSRARAPRRARWPRGCASWAPT